MSINIYLYYSICFCLCVGLPNLLFGQEIFIDGIPFNQSPLRDSLYREALRKSPTLGDTAWLLRNRTSRPDSEWHRYTVTADSNLLGFWSGHYLSFVRQESSYNGVSVRIDSVKGDSVFGVGIFTSSGGVDLGLLKSKLYLRAKRDSNVITGRIIKNNPSVYPDSVNQTYTFSLNCHKVTALPCTTCESVGVLDGYAIARSNREVIPGFFIFWRPQNEEYTPPTYLLPENVFKKEK